MKIKLRPEVDNNEWHRKFIIFPRLIDGYLVFLQTVHRRLLWWDPSGWDNHKWEYTIVKNPQKPVANFDSRTGW